VQDFPYEYYRNTFPSFPANKVAEDGYARDSRKVVLPQAKQLNEAKVEPTSGRFFSGCLTNH